MNDGNRLFSLQSIIKMFRALRGVDFDALNQFAATLQSELDLVSADDSPEVAAQQELIETIMNELNSINKKKSVADNWNHAHRAEILLVSLYSPDRVSIEVHRRFEICVRRKAPFSDFYRRALHPENKALPALAVTPKEKHDLLLSLVRDLQWLSSRQFIKMRYAKIAIYKVGFVFVLSFATFIVILSTGHWDSGEALTNVVSLEVD